MTPSQEIIDLEPCTDPTEKTVYREVDVACGTVTVASPEPTVPVLTSRLPTGRMAARDDWQTIVEALRDGEEGRPPQGDVVLHPGGRLSLAPDAGADRPLSTLPQGRMAAASSAAVTVGPTVADAEEIRRLDPRNVEGWTPVRQGRFGGWTFELCPPIPRCSPPFGSRLPLAQRRQRPAGLAAAPERRRRVSGTNRT